MSSVMSEKPIRINTHAARDVSGNFVNRAGERFYCIRNVDDVPPFFISVISSDDHWLFVSSMGGLTAGRVSPDTALFPYVTVDSIHESLAHTGPLTIVRLPLADGDRLWEPFNEAHRGLYTISRNLYKSTLGDKLCFEEINHDLDLVFSYTWSTSATHGFVRDCELRNIGSSDAQFDIVDGLQNILPAGTPRFAQTNSSNLVDAYKWTELDEQSGLVFLTLYSGITDRAEPSESLKATTVYCLGVNEPTVLVSSDQLDAFRDGHDLRQEHHKRGIRGAYLVAHSGTLTSDHSSTWRFVLDGEQSQDDVVQLRQTLLTDATLDEQISTSVAAGSKELATIMASADAFQATAEENVSVHHYANVLFNVLRGGIVADQYNVSAKDFRRTVHTFNQPVYARNEPLLQSLPDNLRCSDLVDTVRDTGDKQLQRLALEYLPITFGRRHGDPSRPWNEFAIRLKDEHGEGLLSYQGNWRDIFQNWEALAFSYPDFVENMIAKFVNASTIDGYNPYRITKEGIDWEIEEADDPWSYIGYWGDHQIIYLLKLLELSRSFHPTKLSELLRETVFCYANVPYKIKPLEEIFEDPKATVEYDHDLAAIIEQRVATLGADGKLIPDTNGEIYQVNLLEKLIVPLLAKLGNLVVDGGIWLNTQRPEWNDANNALVGQGLSMVTLYYMRRYVVFLRDLLEGDSSSITLSKDVDTWFGDTAVALAELRADLKNHPDPDGLRYRSASALGSAAANFRQRVYAKDALSETCERELDHVRRLLNDALAVIDHSTNVNKRSDGLYNAYNIAAFDGDAVGVSHLYPMLEGQVAALSAGSIDADEVANVIEALFASAVYRADQNSFMLYPDRDLPGFLQRNCLSDESVASIPLLMSLLDHDNDRVVVRDSEGNLRFNANFTNESDLNAALDALEEKYQAAVASDRCAIAQLYESVFHHSQFTGRSGTMFGFEGLGSIYWHMVSKLLLALSENYFGALADGSPQEALQRLGELYYRVRAGLGFNKAPDEYGAFPTDPYSHTPKHAGARQPGMTGQVKEEILTRFGELGVFVKDGCISLTPHLLRRQEFADEEMSLHYLDVAGQWQLLSIPPDGLGFTWCQVPIVYILDQQGSVGLHVNLKDGTTKSFPNFEIPADLSRELFGRTGRIQRITANLDPASLFTIINTKRTGDV